MTALFYVTLFLFVGLCALLCFVILIQESKSLGLGASFGGDAGDSLFGTSTADVLKKFTAYLAGIFLIVCLILSLWTSSIGRAKKAPLGVNIEEVSAGL
ncbi:preprotein translocase subunit SecG [Candidatus Neptunichlamydia sp. REUL1]|uniref:preprotein translocase subunit SecG n=1 Tax=Candidatus Neptunichlamydia sp. REUL1 TaxID=3064277 RepID=UPI00292D8083|nr:preprotein translocase subunit SecG [Candidatus Neptunochlamydia sp. REUL1]